MKKKLIISGVISLAGILTIISGTFLFTPLSTIFCLLGLTTTLGGLQAISIILKDQIYNPPNKNLNMEITNYNCEEKTKAETKIYNKNYQNSKTSSKNNELYKWK